MACQASARMARGWINSSDRLHGGRALVRDGRGNLLSFWECLCFSFSTITEDGCLGVCTGLDLQQTQFPLHPEMNGVRRGFLREAVWWAVRPWRDLALSSTCPADQEDAGGAGSNTILGRELVVNFREERRGSLLRGLMAPRQEPLVETAARRLLWWRPLQSQLFNRFWEDTEKFGIHPGFGGAGRGQMRVGGVSYRARQLLSVRSCQWHAVIGQLFVTSPERDQIAHACRGTLVRLGKKDGRNLSVWRGRGTRDLSREPLRSSAPLFFPHRSLGGRKREGARGGVALWKESDPRVQRGETDVLAVRISPNRKRTRCGRHRRAGETCTNRSNGAAFATKPICSFRCIRFAGWRQRTGPELLRCWSAKKADQPSRLRSLGPAARHVNGEKVSGISVDEVVVAEGEGIWGSYGETAAYIARWPRPFWRDLAGFVAIGSCSSAADTLVRFFTHCTNQ